MIKAIAQLEDAIGDSTQVIITPLDAYELLMEWYKMENLTAKDIHTCSDKCQVPICILRRENRELKKEIEFLRTVGWD